MKTLLQPYLNSDIGINIERPLHIEAARLVAVQNEFFTVIDSQRGYTHHFSYCSILQIIEHEGGIEVGGLFEHKQQFPLVIKISHLPEFTPI
jgi:hypothetical protein